MRSTNAGLPKHVVGQDQAEGNGIQGAAAENIAELSHFPLDMGRVAAEVNRLNNQVLVHSYEEEWRRWN